MEKYKKTLKIRIGLLSLLVIVAIVLAIYDVFVAPKSITSDILFGFQCGLAIGLGALSLIQIIRYSNVLRNEKKLQIQYNTIQKTMSE